MIGHINARPAKDLLWLRRLFVVFAVLTTGSAARSYWVNRGNFDHFDLLYSATLLPLAWGACVVAWRGLWSAFVLLAVVYKSISAFGAFVYFLDMALPSSMFHSSNHPEYLAWNFASLALSEAILIYLCRKYPPDVHGFAPRESVGPALRVLQGGFLLVAIAMTLDIAPTVGRHMTQEGTHDHNCAWVFADLSMVVLLGYAGIAGLRNNWRAFVSMGLIGQTLTAFTNFTHLKSDYEDAYGTAYAPIDLSRNLPVFAFALFSVVYLALRFPPRLTAPATPSASAAPSPAAD
ncbi:hypothetical protein [Polyangium jinanense]|uniref:Uncharacterized protein n=1 Tax=Polyangium jinanense TaxID=2829994 RepID=A0A9X4ASP8_9BACT|nr:hypothetical protein [Polyangium jinanense]MDC3954880.1 hypothetical protein [Polyangium jinanense]MDC3981350.1 hypothetical protein [Polyangium jinanense]